MKRGENKVIGIFLYVEKTAYHLVEKLAYHNREKTAYHLQFAPNREVYRPAAVSPKACNPRGRGRLAGICARLSAAVSAVVSKA